mgnify:CR=1 FL=1
MNYKTIAILQNLVIVAVMASALAFAVMAYDMGKSTNQQVLDNCMNGIDIMHEGKLIRCGIIERVDNLKSARYRSVKNCTKIIKEWEDE